MMLWLAEFCSGFVWGLRGFEAGHIASRALITLATWAAVVGAVLRVVR